MAISIQLPSDIEQYLREEVANLDQAAKEALLVDFYRQERLSHQQLSRALGLSRFETDAVLKRHEAYYDLSAQDMAREGKGNGKFRAGQGPDAAKEMTPAQRVAAWDAWVANMRDWGTKNLPPGHFVDDSRESIYEGRGE